MSARDRTPGPGGNRVPKRALALLFLAALPLSFFIGVTFVLGHARLWPYRGAWADRLAFAAVVLGIPSLAAAAGNLIMRLWKGGRDRS